MPEPRQGSPDAVPARVRRPLFLDGLASRLMDVLTGGPFLAGLGLLVGASNFELGLLAALPFLAQAAQLPTLALLLRVQDRRATVIWSAGIARILLAVVAGLLWLRSDLLSPSLLVAILSIGAILVVTATAAWNWWMRDLLPARSLGAFFSRRLRGTTVAALLAMLAAGAMLDALAQRGLEVQGYALLFILGALWGFVGLAALRRIPHAPPPPSPPATDSLRLLRQAFGRPETRQAFWSLAAVSTAVTFALPFAAVFLLRSLGYSYAVVTALAVVSHLGYLAGLRGWGHISDRLGDRGVLFVSLVPLLFVQLGWAATGWTADAWDLWGWVLLAWLALLHFASGFAVGGADLGGTNLMLKSAPVQHAQAHLAAIGLGKAFLAGVGTVLAGLLWGIIGTAGGWSIGAWSLRGFQVLAAIAAILTVVALVATLRIREARTVPVVEVARTMRREVGQMSSIAGIRGLIHALSYSVELLAAPFAARGQTPAPPAPPEGKSRPRP